jgi:hypothetical protein
VALEVIVRLERSKPTSGVLLLLVAWLLFEITDEPSNAFLGEIIDRLRGQSSCLCQPVFKFPPLAL